MNKKTTILYLEFAYGHYYYSKLDVPSIEDDSYYDFSKVAPREKGVIVKYKTEPIVEYCNIQ